MFHFVPVCRSRYVWYQRNSDPNKCDKFRCVESQICNKRRLENWISEEGKRSESGVESETLSVSNEVVFVNYL